MDAFKLLQVRRDGTIGPLFINRRQVIPIGVWLEAEDHPTAGYAHRPGWHAALTPKAPHLSERRRAWFRVEVEDATILDRPAAQGGQWVLARRMRVIEPVAA